MSRKPTFGHTKSGHEVHAHARHYLPSGTAVARFNSRLGVLITNTVGTMWCAYLFALLSLASLPAILTQAFHLHVFPSWLINASLIALVAWVSSYFLQLVLLPIIIVGQNVQSQASDARAAKTFEDTEVVVDRLNTATKGGITEILLRLDQMDGHDSQLLDEIHRHVTALAPKAGNFPPPPEPAPAAAPKPAAPVSRKLQRPGERM